jgi:hypothetical protein
MRPHPLFAGFIGAARQHHAATESRREISKVLQD